jgi:Resolvase, N terminal domain
MWFLVGQAFVACGGLSRDVERCEDSPPLQLPHPLLRWQQVLQCPLHHLLCGHGQTPTALPESGSVNRKATESPGNGFRIAGAELDRRPAGPRTGTRATARSRSSTSPASGRSRARSWTEIQRPPFMWPQARRPLSRIFSGAARQSPRTCCNSGAKDNQLGLSEALAYSREGDPLVVWKLDRLGRSLKHLVRNRRWATHP